jgi:hypothetical protein
VLGVPQSYVLERVDIEVSPELAVEDVQDVAVELGRHAGGIVVGRDEYIERLDQRAGLGEGGAQRRRGVFGP